jgi:predicted P-loop ATPase
MIDESLKSKIIWADKDLNIAANTIENIETYIDYIYGKRLSLKDKEILLDNEYIAFDLLLFKIERNIKTDLNIKNQKKAIKLVIKAVANKNIVIETNNEGGSPVSEKYINEFNDIQENIDNKDQELSDIIDIINDIPDNDWDIYKKWKKEECMYIRNKDGVITGVDMCYNNIVSWLDNFPITKNKIKWNNIRNVATIDNKPLTDSMMHQIIQMINKYLSKDFSNLKNLRDAIIGCAVKNRYNRFIDYFNSLNYQDDGVDYIEYTIKNVLCCEEQEKYYDLYYETIKIALLACMKRIYYKELYNKPVKYDTVVTLCGKTGGSGKTTFFEKLFDIDDNGNTYCYVVAGDSFSPKDKDFLERTHQSVCVLLDELSMKRSIITSVKGYITQRSDKFRMSYGYNSEDYIRGFIIVATSNNTDILKDYTTDNERRWSIIKMSEDSDNYKKVNEAFENGLRDKLWAFIKHIYDNEDYDLYFTDKEIEDLEKNIQRDYKASNNEDYNSIIYDLLEREYGFYDNDYVDVDLIVNQYKSNDSYEWCIKHNEEFEIKSSKANRDEYIMRYDDRPIKFYGKIDRIQKTVLYNILNKLGFEFTKPSLAAEMRASNIWNGYDNKSCRIGNSMAKAYWRKEKIKRDMFIDRNSTNKQTSIPF